MEPVKNPKMWLFLKTANQRVKRMEIWNNFDVLWCMHVGIFHIRLVEVILGSFGPLCKILMLRFSKCYCSNSFEMTWANLYGDIDSHGEYRLLLSLVICQLLQIWWDFDFSLNIVSAILCWTFQNNTILIWFQAYLVRSMITMGEYMLTLLVICQQFKLKI